MDLGDLSGFQQAVLCVLLIIGSIPFVSMVVVLIRLSMFRKRMSEVVKHSRTINAKTRSQLMAMMLPHGAMPAEEARKVLAKARRLAPQEAIEPLTRQARAETGPKPTRIISPWQIAR